MKIEVTAEDIAAGKRSSLCDCPIALAMKRATGDQEWRVLVPEARRGYGPLIILPPNAVDFATHFDLCMMVEPFVFEVEL